MDEITKHTLKIYKTIRSPNQSVAKKMVDVALEVFIIVFAVSLAQFLERQREDSVKQGEVKEFLLGLRNDMKNDVESTKEIIQLYDEKKYVYTFLGNIKTTIQPNADTLKMYVGQVGNNFFLRPSISRFEGFKSTGKLEEIKDKQLLQNILYYYEQALKQLESSESRWVNLQQKLSEYFMDNKVENDNGSNNYYELITKPKAKNICKAMVPWPQLYERCHAIINLGDKIVAEINKDYPEK